MGVELSVERWWRGSEVMKEMMVICLGVIGGVVEGEGVRGRWRGEGKPTVFRRYGG